MIITADLHLREVPARCRQQNWMETQEQFLRALSKQKEDVCIVGDIFNSSSENSALLITLIQKFARSLYPKKLYLLAGNHDLLFHTVANLDRSAIGILYRSYNIVHLSKLQIAGETISAPNFGQEPDYEASIVFLHQLICAPGEAFPGGLPVEEIYSAFPKAKYVFTGDNHHGFSYKGKVFNPGTPIRQTIDLKNYAPKIIIWNPPEKPILKEFIYDSPEFLKEPIEGVKHALAEAEVATFTDFETMLLKEMSAWPEGNKKAMLTKIYNEASIE